MKKKSLIWFLILLVSILGISGCMAEPPDKSSSGELGEGMETVEVGVEENGRYSGPEDVAEYIQSYGELPSNFLTKKEARDLGWVSENGNLWEVTDQMSIGGDRFGNREGLLPKADGRQWYECDVNYAGGYRGAERLVYSNDGLIYYTDDHYESFQKIGDADDEKN